MNKSTTVDRLAGVAEFRVTYTCLDSEGDQALGVERCDGIAEAHLECSRTLAYQESQGLPADAHIVWRVGGGPWQAWGGAR
ncbi:hypothetical protein ACIBHX_01555 [Nonomuraea sp. NPDC050536]|uniref:hypothetical protein n=1 Tax=Nonomuraea sp. NPDC050536 TaxID=3364366 RepID=UPI0037CC52DF